ncbi:MAG: DUF3793 family protein [Clostridiales bacterium]|nr:DUF3793 family protein [Clostridiales bacterium]
MSEEYVVRQCAPTLAGIKTGSLFPCPYQSRQALMSEIRALNRRLSPKGLILLPVRYLDGKALLYLYRPSNLRQDLKDRLAAQVLEQAGYSCSKSEQCVVRLIRRLKENEDFPHEIGLFLSYPPEDVKGFIDNRACNFKCSGLWKVYGDEARAQAMFARFRKCTEIYCKLWQEGSSIEQLAVAV